MVIEELKTATDPKLRASLERLKATYEEINREEGAMPNHPFAQYGNTNNSPNQKGGRRKCTTRRRKTASGSTRRKTRSGSH